jgi:hypothetical protein
MIGTIWALDEEGLLIEPPGVFQWRRLLSTSFMATVICVGRRLSIGTGSI